MPDNGTIEVVECNQKPGKRRNYIIPLKNELALAPFIAQKNRGD